MLNQGIQDPGDRIKRSPVATAWASRSVPEPFGEDLTLTEQSLTEVVELLHRAIVRYGKARRLMVDKGLAPVAETRVHVSRSLDT